MSKSNTLKLYLSKMIKQFILVLINRLMNVEIQNKIQPNPIQNCHLIQLLNQLIILDLLLNFNQKMICLFKHLIGMRFFIQIKLMIIKSKNLKKKLFRIEMKFLFFKSILIKTGDYGAFLIRPQSKKTSSSDHSYVRFITHC